MPTEPTQTLRVAIEQLSQAGVVFLAVVGLVVLIGAALWLAGARLLRPMLLAGGAAAGVGVGGLVLAPHFASVPEGLVRLLVPLAIGLACGWVIAAIGYRLFVGALTGATLAALAVAGVLAFHAPQPSLVQAQAWTLHAVANDPSLDHPRPTASDMGASNFLAQVRTAGGVALGAAARHWERIDPRTRAQAGLVGVLVGLLGLLAGLAAPKGAAVLPTALIGSALCLGGLLVAATSTQWGTHVGEIGLLPLTVAWAVLALVGAGVQGSGLARARSAPTS